jgi:methylated-DNA-[protein]-cysteine S-methyltransferase
MITSPIGTLIVHATEQGIAGLELGARTTARPAGGGASLEHVRAAEEALSAYFAGARDPFRHLTLAPAGTPFQRSVWEALRTIPYGETISYKELARCIGKPDAMRAVGLANGRNPLPIVVPCHRVIGADGSLTGFGLGVDVKAWLLVHEGATDSLPAPVTAGTRLRAFSTSLRGGIPL